MVLAELKEAANTLARMPVLWIPGVVAGLLASLLWVVLNLLGTFFAGRILLLFSLVFLFFITGMFAVIKKNEGNFTDMIEGGIYYYFRVVLPLLVIAFGIILIFIPIVMFLALTGIKPDIGIISVLDVCITFPIVVLTFFSDTAAVFEDRKVFDSIRRSIELVSTNLGEMIAFFFVCAGMIFAATFGLAIVWSAAFYDRLQVLTTYNETQLQAFTPDQFTAMIAPDGMWLTAIIIFAGMLVLVPLLLSYKAYFFQRLSRNSGVIQQAIGEYDRKGRWYKY